jgi:hypothetical protein
MKQKKRKKLKKTLQPQAPLSIKEAEQKIKAIRAKLQDLKEYKAILAEDGLKPDEEDKRRESELIVRLLRLEKQSGVTKEKEVPWRGKTGNKPSGAGAGKTGNKPSSSDSRPGRKPSGGGGKPGPARSGPANDSRPQDRDRRPRKDGPARTEKKFRDDDRPLAREPKPEGERAPREYKKKINRGSKPAGAKKPTDKKGPSGPKKAGKKRVRRPFTKKTNED